MSETNKRHNRKIWRACPVCKGRVVLGYRNQNWWVYCEANTRHIPQRFFPYAHEAIDEWNVKSNKRSNADRIRAMPDAELAEFLQDVAMQGGIELGGRQITWLDWLRQEAEHGCAD